MNRSSAAGIAALDAPERADANFVVHATWALERTSGMVSHARVDLVIADSGLPCDTFNFICRARLDGATVRPAAVAAVSYFADVQRPFSWWVGPADRPRELGAVLDHLGLARAETELAMAMALDALPEAVPPVPGLEVRRVRTAAVLLGSAAPQWFFVGYLNGEPVATAEATLYAGTAGLYNIATRAGFRGRGIGSMLMWQALRDARGRV